MWAWVKDEGLTLKFIDDLYLQSRNLSTQGSGLSQLAIKQDLKIGYGPEMAWHGRNVGHFIV